MKPKEHLSNISEKVDELNKAILEAYHDDCLTYLQIEKAGDLAWACHMNVDIKFRVLQPEVFSAVELLEAHGVEVKGLI